MSMSLPGPAAWPTSARRITVPATAPACTYTCTTGDAYETITGQVQVTPAAGITTSPGAGLSLALLSTH